MIEIICNGKGDKTGNSENTSVKELPKNIKQIGDVSSGKKIYIEDYAFTYINSIAYQSEDTELAGVLLGEMSRVEGQVCIFIKGVIKAKNPDTDSREICFNEAVWSQIYNESEKYFPDLSIVGWFAALPRINSESMARMKKIHLDNFSGKEKTMYLVDIEEKEESFYLYEGGVMKKQRGYVCFYERNYEMQEYMLDKNRNKFVEKPETEKVVSSMRAIMREKEEQKRQKRASLISYGACAFMASVVVITGVNLVKSYEKMKRIDNSINSIVKEVSNLSGKETETVAQDDVVPVNVVYETKAAGSATAESSTAAASGATSATGTSAAGTSATGTSATGTSVTGTSSMGASTTEASAAGQQAETVAATESAAAQEAAAPVEYKKYIVKKGDTILGISKKNYGTTEMASQIIELNDLKDANKLYVGQEIKLP